MTKKKTKSKYANKYFSVEKTKAYQKRFATDLRAWKLQGLNEGEAYKSFSKEAQDIDSRSRHGLFKAIWQAFTPTIRVQVVTIDGRPINRGKGYGEIISEVVYYAAPSPLSDADVGDLIAPMTLMDQKNKYGLLRSGAKNRIDWQAAFHTRTISSLAGDDLSKLIFSKGELIDKITSLIVSGANTYTQGSGKGKSYKGSGQAILDV
jgi:hypothetical protein